MTQGTARDIDLLGFGVAAVDELIELDEHPPRDVKIDLRSHETQAGGICVNALAAAARLGLRCHFAGPLGRNTLSDVVRRGMSGFGITFEPPHRCDDAGPSHAFILVDRATGSRTILMNKARVIDLRPGEPDASLIARARAMYVDAWHLDAGLDAVRTARARGVITVADFEEHDPERVRLLLPSIDHLILPVQYATRLTGETDPVAAIARLSPATRACTAVTIGADGAWFATGADPDVPRRQAAF
ncbi:MAG: carbohydrate kinase family protein, partial [Phycisphaerales bacterium]|nr:carbohydrate kinase family protein [Phycisphaerales bacterium]